VLRILHEQQPDILLLEPRIDDALSVLNTLRADLVRTRAIIMTTSTNQEELVEAVKLGAFGIVHKQVPTELLIKSIRKVHSGEPWLDLQTTAAVMRQFASAGSRSTRHARSSSLTPREREILVLVAQGRKNKEIAKELFISEQTVKNHLHKVCDSLGVTGRIELVLYAVHHKILPG
jgi:DNA-binding NarL/FixJ family response regulator